MVLPGKNAIFRCSVSLVNELLNNMVTKSLKYTYNDLAIQNTHTEISSSHYQKEKA